jgi:hypothetical protein
VQTLTAAGAAALPKRTKLSKPAEHSKPSDVQVPAVAVGLIIAFEQTEKLFEKPIRSRWLG